MTARLRVYRPTKSAGSFGSGMARYSDYNGGRAIAAERRRQYGAARVEVGEMFADYRAEYYVWWQHRVDAGWRVEDTETGVLYEVKTMIPDRRNNLRLLNCERVNR